MSAQNILAERQRAFADLLALQPAEIQGIVQRVLTLPGVQESPLFGLIIQRPVAFFSFAAAQMQQVHGRQIEAVQMPGHEPEDFTRDFSDLRSFFEIYLTAANLLDDLDLAYLIVRPDGDDAGEQEVTLDVAYNRSLLNPDNPESIARNALAVAATLADPNQPHHIRGTDVIQMFRTAFPRNALTTLLGNLDRTRRHQEVGMMVDGFGLFVHIFLYFVDLANPGGVWGSLVGNENDSAAFLYAMLDVWTGTGLQFAPANRADQERYQRYLGAVRQFANTPLSGFGPILAQFRRTDYPQTGAQIEAVFTHHWNLIIGWMPNLRQDILNVFEATRDDMFRLVDEIQVMTQINRGDRVMEGNVQTHVNIDALVGDHSQFGTVPGGSAAPAAPAAAFRGFEPREDLVDGTETGPDCQLCANPMGAPPRQEPQRVLRCCRAEVGAVCHAEAVRLYGHCPFCRKVYGKDGEFHGAPFDGQDPPSGPGAGAAGQGGDAQQDGAQGGGAGPAQPAAQQPSGGDAGGGGGGCAGGVVVYSRARRSHKFVMCPLPASRYGTDVSGGAPIYGPPMAANNWFVDTFVPAANWQYTEKYRAWSLGEQWEGRTYTLSNEALPAPSAFERQPFTIWLLTVVQPLYVQAVNRVTTTV